MRQTRTIRFRLSMALLQVFALIAVLALVSLWRLTDYHRTAGDIHDRYLPATQYLGELSTLTAELHALEAMALLPATESERRAHLDEIGNIDVRISDDLAAYEAVPPQLDVQPLYRDFSEKWLSYRTLVGQTLSLAGQQPAEAATLFRGASQTAYDAAADSLWVLSQHTRMAADAASRRTQISYSQALWLTIAAIALGGLISLGGIVHIRRAILSPLARLSRAMRQLSANELEIDPLEPGRGDEIGDMAQAVEVFRLNAVILNEKLAQEQKLAELQRNFVAMASHEFRTPLTVIDGQAQRLINRGGDADTAEIAERAGKIRQAVARMTGVIGSLIDSARLIESPSADFTRFDLAPLLREVCQFHRDMTASRIVERIPAEPLMITADPKLLFQLFSNILSNAAKYSRDQSAIEIEAERRDDRLAVSIADQGMGIPPADLERLFERYFRGSNAEGTVGTGIGLYLVKIVLDLHGGEIAVESREGHGSRFTVSLPTLVTSRTSGMAPSTEE